MFIYIYIYIDIYIYENVLVQHKVSEIICEISVTRAQGVWRNGLCAGSTRGEEENEQHHCL